MQRKAFSKEVVTGTVDEKLLPPTCCSQQQALYQVPTTAMNLRAAFIRNNDHAKRILNCFHVKFLHDMARFTTAWTALCHLSALQCKTPEGTWRLVMDAPKQDMKLSFFSSAKCNIISKCYKVMETFANLLWSFILPPCVFAQGRSKNGSHVLLHDLFKIIFGKFDDEKALHAKDCAISGISISRRHQR